MTVIVPVHNGARYLDACLDALLASSHTAHEIIVVDDASTDNSASISLSKKVKLLRLGTCSGAAAARNAGAREARGDVLFFVDADVLVRPETINRIAKLFRQLPDVTAIFGSYDEEPAEQNFFSQYKNLYHHFIHQQAEHESLTFWAGCGAMRREAFEAARGFDEQRFSASSIEDIELGCRMSKMGFRILLDKSLQVKHLKRWTFKSLLHADILRRALPWSRLILENGKHPNDLNLRRSHRISAALVGLLLVLLPLALLFPTLFYIEGTILAFILSLNHKLYLFFMRRRGLVFTAMAIPMHIFYYFYSGVVFVSCWLMYLTKRKTAPSEVRSQ